MDKKEEIKELETLIVQCETRIALENLSIEQYKNKIKTLNDTDIKKESR